MRGILTGTAIGSLVIWGATNSEAAPGVPGVVVDAGERHVPAHCMNLDTWDDVLENLRLLCLVLGCSVGRVFDTDGHEQVEQLGWNVVLSYTTSGLREDLTLVEREQGASAAESLLVQLAQTPSVVSEALRPQLLDVTQAIAEEVLP